ncbi:MAG TPA: universal stress protein [Candidatus Acidoferrum sp.]|nr:universal stress protein [Candidatus Acidoferrum sp.]
MSIGKSIVRGDQVRPESEFRRVLVLSDFSRGAKSALQFARAIARKFNSKIYILHVIPSGVFQFLSGHSRGEALLLANEFARDGMQMLLKEGKSEGFDEEGIVAEGTLWPTISKTIQSRQIDLIAMGTHGNANERKLGLGSVSEQIYRVADCPILTAPPLPGLNAMPEIQRILFATNFKPHSERAAFAAHSLGCGPNRKLTVLHVVEESSESSQQSNQIVREFFVKRMAKCIPTPCEDNCSPEYEIRFGKPMEEILSASDQLHSDLIFLGVRREQRATGHLPSALAYGIVCRSNCPVLTIQ